MIEERGAGGYAWFRPQQKKKSHAVDFEVLSQGEVSKFIAIVLGDTTSSHLSAC